MAATLALTCALAFLITVFRQTETLAFDEMFEANFGCTPAPAIAMEGATRIDKSSGEVQLVEMTLAESSYTVAIGNSTARGTDPAGTEYTSRVRVDFRGFTSAWL